MRQFFALLTIVSLITAFGVFSANRANQANDNANRTLSSTTAPMIATK